MMPDTTEQMNRRQFFRTAGRWSLFGFLAALSGTLARRSVRENPDREKCINMGICRECNAFEDCGLPQALSAKQHRDNTK